VSIGVSVAVALAELPRTRNIALSYTFGATNGETIALMVTFLIFAVGLTLQVVMTYFPLKALAYILRVLMQMEYNSRKTVSAQAAEN
jgi:hypothetical protein